MSKYAVTINFHAHYGYIEYDPDTKRASVVLDDEAAAAKTAVEKYLSEPHTFRIASHPESFGQPGSVPAVPDPHVGGNGRPRRMEHASRNGGNLPGRPVTIQYRAELESAV